MLQVEHDQDNAAKWNIQATEGQYFKNVCISI